MLNVDDTYHECLNHDTINTLEAHNENCLGTFFRSSPNERNRRSEENSLIFAVSISYTFIHSRQIRKFESR